MWFSKMRMLLHGMVVLAKVTTEGLLNNILLVGSFFLSRVLKRPLIKGQPRAISVEPSGLCNLQCPECPVGAGVLTRKGGMMEPELFQKIVDEGGKALRIVNLFFQGEPMLNSKIGSMIKIAHRKRIYTNMSTNGHHLSEKRCHELITAGLTRIIISLDGLTRETYSIYRKGGDITKVKEGVENIVKIRKQSRSVTPFIVVQFLVFSHNEHEIPELKRWCRETGVDKLELKTAQINEFGNNTVQPPANLKYSRYLQNTDGSLVLKGKSYNHCYKQWSSVVVSWDGKMAPCCYDKDLDFSPGDVIQNSLSVLWRNDSLQNFRKQILNNKSKIDMCRNCPEGRNHWI